MLRDLRGPVAVAAMVAAVHAWIAATPGVAGASARVFRSALAGTTGPARGILTAPWVHGDATHLGTNLLGLLLLGTVVVRARGEGFALVVLVTGALLGATAATSRGAVSLGISGGVYALAGAALLAGPPGRGLGAAWLVLGFLGGRLGGSTDEVAHLAGAAAGLALAAGMPRVPWAARAIAVALALGGLPFLASRRGPVAERMASRAGWLEALETMGEALRVRVAWNQARRRALGSHLDAARGGGSLAATAADLRASLRPPPDLLRLLADLDAAREGGLELLPSWDSLRPEDPPSWFLAEASGDLPVEEGRKAEWEALMAYLRAGESAAEGFGEELRDLADSNLRVLAGDRR